MTQKSSAELMLAALCQLEECGMMGSARIVAEVLLATECSATSTVEYKLKALVVLADSLVDTQEYRRAVWYYKEYVKIYRGLLQTQRTPHLAAKCPSLAEVNWRIYKCFDFLHAYQEALDFLSSIEVADVTPKMFMAQGKLYQHFHRDRHAQMCYKKVLCSMPYAAEAMAGLMSLGMTPPEVAMICKANTQLSADDNSAFFDSDGMSAWMNGTYAEMMHDYEGAVKAYGRLSKPPYSTTPDMKCTLGRCMWKLGREAQATELFSISRAADPFVLRHMDLYAQILSSSKAIPSLEKLVHSLFQATTIHHQPYVARAVLLSSNDKLMKDERNKCLLCTAKAIKLNPRSPEAHYIQGKLALSGQDIRKAGFEFVEAINADPTHFGAYKCLVKCYCTFGNEDEALSISRALSKHLKNKAQSYYLEGMVYAFKDFSPTKAAKAKSAFLKSIKTDPLFTDPVLCLAEVYDKQQNTAKAIELLSQSIVTNPSAQLHSVIAKYHMKLKQYEHAQDHYTKALGLDIKYREAIDGMKDLNRLISSSEMDITHDDSSPVDSDISVNTLNGGLELDLDSEDSTSPADLTNQLNMAPADLEL